jgi:hypothetical protein
MKKIFLLLALIITPISVYMNAETSNKVNSKCEVCNQGYLQKTKANVIFEITEKGLEPRFDGGFLKCDHCQSFTPVRNYGAHFSIPAH